MTDFIGLNYKNLVMNFKKAIIKHPYYGNYIEVSRIDKAAFLKDNNNINAESIFAQLDFDNDGYITEQEFQRIKWTDRDSDGNISEDENTQNKELAMNQALFSARRNIDKWFTVDIDRDGQWSNVEDHLAIFRMKGDDPNREHQLDASMSNEELAEKYNITEAINGKTYQLSQWIDNWANRIKRDTKRQFGVDLSDADMVNIKKEMIKQLNTWLFKTGDNATHDAPMYNSLNIDSYTRLVTWEEAVSCCGGDVTPPPAACNKDVCELLFTSLEYSDENWQDAEKEIQEFMANVKAKNNIENMTMEEEIQFDQYCKEEREKIYEKHQPHNKSEEVHNRLAWAIYPEPQRVREIKEQMNKEIEAKIKSGEYTPEEIADLLKYSVWEKMSDEEYAQYHEQYMNIRNMSAADFRELLKHENEEQRKKFEENSNMTVHQIVQYIDIVESVTGQDFDSTDWKINAEQFLEITYRVNDTQDDAGLLEGKTRKDVPENRQKLLRFLEEKGWLYEQFKVNPAKKEETE